MIKGKFYRPFDNSWCTNVEAGIKASLVGRGLHTDEVSDCRFKIVSEPYIVEIHEDYISRPIIRTFVNVESLNTGIVYRTLFCEENVVNYN